MRELGIGAVVVILGALVVVGIGAWRGMPSRLEVFGVLGLQLGSPAAPLPSWGENGSQGAAGPPKRPASAHLAAGNAGHGLGADCAGARGDLMDCAARTGPAGLPTGSPQDPRGAPASGLPASQPTPLPAWP